MAYIDLTPRVVSTDNDQNWTQLSKLIVEDNEYTTNAANSTSSLFLEYYTPKQNTPALPLDTIINGVQIFFSAKTAGVVANAYLDFSLYSTKTRTILGSAIRSIALTTTEVTSSVGSSTNTFYKPLRWVDLNYFYKNTIRGNPWFGTKITVPTAVNSIISIDSVYARVHYTSYGYLVGSRTRFYLGREDLGKDAVISANTAHPSSYIRRKDNGIPIANQIKSHDVNMLGDAIYNVESAILAATGFVYAIDLKKTYVFTITVSANCDNSNVYSNAIVYGQYSTNGQSNSNYVNMVPASIYRSTIPSVTGTINCFWTSAIAWVEHSGTWATNSNHRTSKLYASSPAATFTRKSNGDIDFVIGVTVVGSALGIVADYDASEGSDGAYKGYIGSTFTPAPASGHIFFKILAIGRAP